MEAIHDLVARSNPHPELSKFLAFHQMHPEVLDFLVSEIQLRLTRGFSAFSYGSLWDYARWKLEMDKGPGETFLMNDHLVPLYGRAITVLHPEFNGHCQFRTADADAIFGLRIEPLPDKRSENYARRLEWADGTLIEEGWRPENPHIVRRAIRMKKDIH